VLLAFEGRHWTKSWKYTASWKKKKNDGQVQL